ncbi:MAG: hypothetical protein JKX73_08340, partial [Flavobacteriales bacterium]|nr:hypothetical protein [Flavobacteriales bacterium]
MKHILRGLTVFVAILAMNSGVFNTAKATHIIGGELIYRCLDPTTNYYQFTVKLYRACKVDEFGQPTSIYFDQVIYVSLYDSNDVLVQQFDMDLIQETDTLDNSTYNICLFAPPDVCVEEGIYTDKFFLPTPPSPNMHYTMTYQRCCRNDLIQNVILPLGVGAAWVLNVPDSSKAYCNSSPVFKNYPPTIICLNDTMWYDHSAVDLDGDSLVYALCEAQTIASFNQGGGVQNPAEPTSFYYYVPYFPPYNFQYPINCSGPGGDTLKIDPQTGLLTIKPTQAGMWVVAVCVYEYRNGILINEHKRDFQFNVASCLTDPMTQFTAKPDSCDPRIVQFFYGGNDVANWNWDFGVSNTLDD